MIKIIDTINEIRNIVSAWKAEGFTIGFVPTMGYLHEGHKSLITKSVSENQKTIVSIFVNPIQFGVNEDLDKYPRDLQRDIEICESANADVIFHPLVSEMYGSDFSAFVDLTKLTDNLCGASRPNHFRGVCTVVAKLFNIVKADRAYFGKKDYQQLAVIKRMVSDLNFDIKIIGCSIIREGDGLAMSSRNAYLNKEERVAALCLNSAIKLAENLLKNGEKNAMKIRQQMIDLIEKQPLAKIDYVELVDAETLEKVNKIDGQILCALAVFIGKTRLIDNFDF